MTLNDILVSALAQLDRGHDAQTMEIFRARLTGFANDAQDDLAEAVCLRKSEEKPTVNGILVLSSLSRPCVKVLKTTQLAHEVRFMEDGAGRIALPYNTPVTVEYRYMPKRLVLPGDVSELPEHTHPLMVSYIVGRERMGGDVSAQRGANIYLSMYEAAKSKLRAHVGGLDSYLITNRY